MSALERLTAPAQLDTATAWAAVLVAGAGTVIALSGAAAGRVELAAAGAVAFGIALVVLLAAGWIDALAVLALSLPLPALYSSERFRLSPAAVITAAVLLAWSLRRGADGRKIEFGLLPRGATIGLLGAVALSTLFAQYLLPAFRELVNFAVVLGLLVVATDQLSGAPRKSESLALALAGIVAACGALAVLQAIGVFPSRFPLAGTPFNRATLGFGWPNELGMFMAVALPFSVYACTAARGLAGRILAMVGLGASVLGLAATFSRGSWLAVPAGALALLLTGQRRLVLRIWSVALISALAIDLASGGALRERIASTIGDWVVEQRVALMLAGLLMFRAYPIVGVGPGGFAENLERFGPQISWLWDYTGSAHNAYVHTAAEMGLVGLGALLFFFGALFVVLLRGARRAGSHPDVPARQAGLRHTVLWSFVIACLVSFMEWPFAHGIGQLIMLVAAMGFASPATEVRQR